MTDNHAFVVDVSAQELSTSGLRAVGMPEIHLVRPAPEMEQAAIAMMESLGDYLVRQPKVVEAEHKFSHGYWVLLFRVRPDGDFDIFESNADGSEYVRGAKLALRYWADQSEICRGAGVHMAPPRPDQKAAVSLGVLEGDLPVSGVRYEAPPHMSGWYLTTDRFSGDTKDLRVEHLYHVTACRPDVAPYLALPSGCRFEVTNEGGAAVVDDQILKEGGSRI